MKPISRFVRLAVILSCVAAAAASAHADVKIKTRNTSAGQTTEGVTYIKGKRQRSEYGPSAVTIMQCDLRRSLQLAVPTKTYVVTPFGGNDAAGGAASSAAGGRPAPATRGGVVTTTYTSTDTGERKQMFGYTARRIKTSIVSESSPDACNQNKSRMESDGWYIDAAFALDCDMQAGGGYTPAAAAGGCRDTYRMKQAGSAKLGYPVMVTTTIFDDAGKASFTFTQEVLEISKAVLDAALFEVPAGFREVSDTQALYSGAASPAGDDEGNDGGDDVAGDGPNVAGSAAPSAASGAGPKRAGVVRVGVAVLRAAAAGNVSSESLASSLREGFAGRLTGPTVEVTALTSELPEQIEEEARRKGCDYVLYTAATHKKGSSGGGFGGFLKKAAPVIASGGDADSSGGGAGFKSKDELTLEYTLQRSGASTLAASATLKAKAKADGEDLVGQLVGQAAPAVAAELRK